MAAFHQGFEHEQRGKQGITLRQVHAKAHTPGFFATDQHIAGQHLRCDVFESHRQLQHVSAQVFGHEAHQVGTAHGLHHQSRQRPCSRQVIDQQWHQLLGAAELSVFIHSGNPVAVAVEHHADCGLAGVGGGFHLGDQFLQVGSERFRWIAPEQGIPLAADFLDRPFAAPQEVGHAAGR